MEGMPIFCIRFRSYDQYLLVKQIGQTGLSAGEKCSGLITLGTMCRVLASEFPMYTKGLFAGRGRFFVPDFFLYAAVIVVTDPKGVDRLFSAATRHRVNS